MEKLIFISLLIMSFCDAADPGYYKEARNAATQGRWRDLHSLVDLVGINEIGKESEPFINLPIIHNNLKMTQELLDKGATLNILAAATPLQRASLRYLLYKDNIPLITLLLETGANPHMRNTMGDNSFDFIKRYMNVLKDGPERGQKLNDLLEQYDRKNIKPATKKVQ